METAPLRIAGNSNFTGPFGRRAPTIERADDVKQRAFPRTARSHHGDHLPARHRQVDAAEHGDDSPVSTAKRLDQIPRNQDTHQASLPHVATALRDNLTPDAAAGHDGALAPASGP